MSLLHRFQRVITPKGEKTTDTAVMQTSNPSVDHHGDGVELSDPCKNPHETKIEAGEDSASEDDVYVDVFLNGFCVADDYSPYPDVQASVSNTDEDLPVNTFRAWFLGIIGTMVLTALNQFFQLHNPPLMLSAYIAIFATLPCGRLMAATLPTKVWSVFGWQFTLNPGPFNQKEHSIVAIMASLVTAFDNGSLASDVYVAFDKFLNIPISVGYRFVFLLSTQALSFGIAGLFHRFLVEPAFCVWPAALPICSLLYTFHEKKGQKNQVHGWKISRMGFFSIVVSCGAAYQFVPGYLFTGLTTFAWITWIVPKNVTVNQVFGATSGMDLLPLTLDWNQITGYLGSPLLVPSWALVNVFCGSILFLWIISPALHWSNVWQGMYLPFSSSGNFDNTGKPYNTTLVMNPDYSLNETAYYNYSPIYLPTTSALSYGLGFAGVASIVVHTILYHRQAVWNGLLASIGRPSTLEKSDVHGRVNNPPPLYAPPDMILLTLSQLMQKYKQVPMWWYSSVFLTIFGLSIAFLYVYDTGLPWYGLILAIAVDVVLLVPTGIMMAICNIKLSTAVISALIAGYIWPGKMMNNVVFKIFTLVSSAQGLGYIQDMKIGHYMKVPPRVTFAAQCTGILVSWLTQTAVNIWAMGNIEGICTPNARNNFTCPLASGYATNAVFWGLIGPKRLFSEGSMYRPMLWFFLIGALLPVVFYYLDRRFPKMKLRKVHLPAVFASTASIPPATAANYMAWGLVGLLFNGYIKRTYNAWWMRYNYILSAGLDAALAIGSFLIFFCLVYPGVRLEWFGNSISQKTADGMGMALWEVGEGEKFGATTWK